MRRIIGELLTYGLADAMIVVVLYVAFVFWMMSGARGGMPVPSDPPHQQAPNALDSSSEIYHSAPPDTLSKLPPPPSYESQPGEASEGEASDSNDEP